MHFTISRTSAYIAISFMALLMVIAILLTYVYILDPRWSLKRCTNYVKDYEVVIDNGNRKEFQILNTKNGKVRTVLSCGIPMRKLPQSCEPSRTSGPDPKTGAYDLLGFPPYILGIAANPNVDGVQEFSGQWDVPGIPRFRKVFNQNVYLYNGAISRSCGIVQPVLQFGENVGGGSDTAWNIGSWYAFLDFTTFHSDLSIVVEPNDKIRGVITSKAVPNELSGYCAPSETPCQMVTITTTVLQGKAQGQFTTLRIIGTAVRKLSSPLVAFEVFPVYQPTYFPNEPLECKLYKGVNSTCLYFRDLCIEAENNYNNSNFAGVGSQSACTKDTNNIKKSNYWTVVSSDVRRWGVKAATQYGNMDDGFSDGTTVRIDMPLPLKDK